MEQYKNVRQIIDERKFLLELFDVVDDDEERNKINSPSDFLKLSDSEQEELVNYCLVAFLPSSTVDNGITSYGMKHIFEDQVNGFYTHNGQFKGAMLIAGYLPVNPHELNWIYKVDKGCFGVSGFGRNRRLSNQTNLLLNVSDLLKNIPQEDKEYLFNNKFSKQEINKFASALNNGSLYFR